MPPMIPMRALLLLAVIGSASCLAEPFIRVPFDVASAKLAPGFQGSDLHALIDGLEKQRSQSVKGEFESSEEARRRIFALKEQPLYGQVRRSDVIVFVLPSDAVWSEYDADKQELSVIWSPHSYDSGSPNMREAIVQREYRELAPYVGSNAFGVSKKVTRSRLVVESVNFHVPNGWSQLSERVQVPRDAARQLKDGIRVLLIGKLKGEAIETKDDAATPTLDNPSEMSVKQLSIGLTVMTVWLVNIQNGQILKKANLPAR